MLSWPQDKVQGQNTTPAGLGALESSVTLGSAQSLTYIPQSLRLRAIVSDTPTQNQQRRKIALRCEVSVRH